MTREEAKELFRDDVDSYGKPKKIMTKIDNIHDYFESRACENCKFLNVGPYDICPIVEPLSRQYLDYDESTFSCNRWRLKDVEKFKEFR